VFKPGEAQLFSPNLSAWLLLELCPGRTDLELEAEFIQAVAPTMDENEARQQSQQGIDILLQHGLIERVAGAANRNMITGQEASQ